jgi:predicted TPR repeat methyltransferase
VPDTACVLLPACLQLVVPGSDLWKRTADMASTATALSAAASAFGATAAATATGAGGSTSLIRSLGHTQFLAMSVSMAVPWLPAEYIRLCTGLRYQRRMQHASCAECSEWCRGLSAEY